MIAFSCSTCGNALRVADEHAGKTGKCNRCGETLRIPLAPAAVVLNEPPNSAPNRSAALAGEKVLYYESPYPYGADRDSIIGYIIVVAFLAGIAAFQEAYAAALVLFTAGSLFFLGLCLIIRRQSKSTSLEITNRKVTLRQGIFVTTENVVWMKDVRNVVIAQASRQRKLDIGMVGVSSAGQSDIEIEVNHIPNPHRIREIIDQHRT